MRVCGSREEPACDRTVARQGAAFRWSADRTDVEDDRPEDASGFGGAQHVACRPRAATPPDRSVDTAQEIAHECTPRAALAPQWPCPKQSSRLRAERKGPDVNEIECQERKRKRRQVAADRGPRARTRRETPQRRAHAHAREGNNAASAIRAGTVNLDEPTARRPPKRHG